MPDYLFEESQSFRQPLLWLFMGIVLLLAAGPQLWIMLGRNGVSAVQIAVLAVTVAIFLGVGSLLYLSRVETAVGSQGLIYRFYPLQISRRTLPWEDMHSLEVVTVKPIRDFGGWGLRYSGKGTALIVSGNLCVRIGLANSGSLFIGSAKPGQLLAALETGRLKASQTLPVDQAGEPSSPCD